MSEQAGRYQRSAAGMIGAMLLLLGLIAAFVGFRALNRTDPEAQVRAVDYVQVADYASTQVDFDLLAPASLPVGWRATVAQFSADPSSWHLRTLTDEERYVGLEQARSSEEEMVQTYVDEEASRGEVVDVEGRPWRVWTDEDGDTALVSTTAGVTTLVVGTVEEKVLTDFVGSLE